MLYKDPFIIHPKTFELIQKLQTIPFLQDFHLVGGTSLALQIGHRNSIDIDLFTQNIFDPNELIETLSEFHSMKVTLLRPNTVLSIIDDVKSDFVKHIMPL